MRPDTRDLVAYTWPSPGLTIETAGWFSDHDIAAVATDLIDRLLPHVFYERFGAETYLEAHARRFPSLSYRVVAIVAADERTDP